MQRPPQPGPPRQPSGTQLLTLLWPWPLLRPLRVQGATLQKKHHPTPASVVQSSPAHYDPAVRARARPYSC
ncbi:hypothetical protein CEE63_08170 [Stenotrophomonas maltophilia]|uniref:Uncharacterized protein n=1 Tax=Stenotrophomonas maltophilia TaxID=40324 RepID=A0A2D0ALA0_STEMA|nr:hypothetical protein CEE63_08170 [Stenotrophomonas maltophilia]